MFCSYSREKDIHLFQLNWNLMYSLKCADDKSELKIYLKHFVMF